MSRSTIARLGCALCAAAVLLSPGCNSGAMQDPAPGAALPTMVSARALSEHFIEVEFGSQVPEYATDPSLYRIASPSGARLGVMNAETQGDAYSVLLTTDAQEAVQYRLFPASAVPAGTGGGASFEIPIGAIGFLGSESGEPFVESAVALSSTTVLVTFSEEVDATLASVPSFYKVFDPDGNTDVDIQILGAAIGADRSSALLTTTPQENLNYWIQVTNVKSRFRCEFGETTLLDATADGQPGLCTEDARSLQTLDGTTAPFTLTARSNISTSLPLDPDAAGVPADVTTSSCGLGVGCPPQFPQIDGSNSASDEEVIFNFPNLVRADRVQLGMRDLSFFGDDPVLFAASNQAAGFDLLADEATIESAYAATASNIGRILFASIPGFDGSVQLERFKLRSTGGAFCLSSICITDGLRIDPTRSTVSFQGIPPFDNVSPALTRAVATSNTSVTLFFSEPLGQGAADLANVLIEPAPCAGNAGCPELVVRNAALTRFETQIELDTLPQTAGITYRVQVSGVIDKAGNPIGSNDEVDFDSIAPINLSPPRVVGAISTSNTSFVVTFNKPMGDSALVSSNYVVVQVNLNSEVGAIGLLGNRCDGDSTNAGDDCDTDDDCDAGACIQSPRFLGPDRTAVEIDTTSQNEVTYEVTVVNVRDLEGNQLAPPEILVNPAKAEFPGTPPSGQIVDTDGDGIGDNEETRGYVILVTRTGGEVDALEVTSDPLLADTDGDRLLDGEERSRFSDPRSGDTDKDGLGDFEEAFKWGSSLANQDTDGDTLPDGREVNEFNSSPVFADTDGDGIRDDNERLLGNRDARIADLPDPGISVGQISLTLDTRFAYTDTQGESATREESTSATLVQSESDTYSTSDSSTNQNAIGVGAQFGFESGSSGTKYSGSASVNYGYTREDTFTASQSSTTETQEQFQQSLSTSVSRDRSQSVTRTVEGANVQALVTINNDGDIPFTVRNIELTGLLQNPFDRRSFVPVATLLPASELLGGGDLEVSLGPFVPERGPFIFENREVFPQLVEDLMKNPRGLIFRVANFDIVDEDGRNFAFTTQDVNDRTAGVIIDYGTGAVDRFRASTWSPFVLSACDALSDNTGDFCRSDDDCPSGTCNKSDGRPEGVSMSFLLQDVLGFQKNEPANAIIVGENSCAETAAFGDDIQVVVPVCAPVPQGGDIVLPGPNGILNTIAVGDDRRDATGTKIIDGGDGCAHTRASRDDVQVVPAFCETAFPDGVVVLPGPDGVFATTPGGDDVLETVTGYETNEIGVCDGDTDVAVTPGVNGVLDSILTLDPQAPLGDDVEVGGEVLPGPNGILETTPRGDDLLQGPGLQCNIDADCPGGNCQAVERLVRVKGVRNNDADRRFWTILSVLDVPPDVDFDDIRLVSGEEFSLAYVQDRDRDGLIAREEFLYGSSDRDPNTDGCPLGDGAVGCDAEVFNFDTIPDFDEVRKGWEIAVEGVRRYFSFPNPVLPDTDADRLFDDEELALGTDPGKRDTDDDEIQDYPEVRGYEIRRRDDRLIRNVVPYQSAIITPGQNGVLDTVVMAPDLQSADQFARPIIIPFVDPTDLDDTGAGQLFSIPTGDDLLVETMVILDGGNGQSETLALGDDLQIRGAAPLSRNTVSVSFVGFNSGGDACDGFLDGEYSFEFDVIKGDEIIATIAEDGIVSQDRNETFMFSPNMTDVEIGLEDAVTIAARIRENDFECSGGVSQRAVMEPLAAVTAGPNGIAETSKAVGSDDVELIDPDNGVQNRVGPFMVTITAGLDGMLDTIALGGDDTLEPQVIIEPNSGGDGKVSARVPVDPTGAPLVDDIQELPADVGASALPGQVLISPGPNGILETPTSGDDTLPNLYLPPFVADSVALEDDEQLIDLAAAAKPGQFIITCGPDGEPSAMIPRGVPGVCFDPMTEEVRRPDACAPVIRVGEDSTLDVAFSFKKDTSDDTQLIEVGSAVSPGDVIIGPGVNGILETLPADRRIVSDGNGLDSTAEGDDITAGEAIYPGPNRVLDTVPTGNDTIEIISGVDLEEVVDPFVPEGLDCSLCPLETCITNCMLCAGGLCVSNDVLLDRSVGLPCDDGVCPCGDCVAGTSDGENLILEFELPTLQFLAGTTLEVRNNVLVPSPDGSTEDFSLGNIFSGCLEDSELLIDLTLVEGSAVPQGAVLVRPGPNGRLDTQPFGDDILGAPHASLYATNPLNRDTDGDGLFDGAEIVLGANPNDGTDASKFRDDDLDGLANIVEETGWFVGFFDDRGLICYRSDGAEISVLNPEEPPAECQIFSSDPFEPDSDFDGMPDLLESIIRSNPTTEDTDGDGLLDLDEFDPDSTFSVNVGDFREFARRCSEAERCTFAPIDAPYGTSVSMADTDQDGRNDRAELFDDWIITPCLDPDREQQLPIAVTSSPFSADIDRDGLTDGEEESLGLDPQNSDTDGDGISDAIDPQADGCGKNVTVSIDSYTTGNDDCDGGTTGKGDFTFTVRVNPPTGSRSTVSGSAKLDKNSTFNFASNSKTFTMTPGQSFTITGDVNESDSTSGDEDWNLGTIRFNEAGLPIGNNTRTISPNSSGSGNADSCYNGHSITLTVDVTGA